MYDYNIHIFIYSTHIQTIKTMKSRIMNHPQWLTGNGWNCDMMSLVIIKYIRSYRFPPYSPVDGILAFECL